MRPRKTKGGKKKPPTHRPVDPRHTHTPVDHVAPGEQTPKNDGRQDSGEDPKAAARLQHWAEDSLIDFAIAFLLAQHAPFDRIAEFTLINGLKGSVLRRPWFTHSSRLPSSK